MLKQTEKAERKAKNKDEAIMARKPTFRVYSARGIIEKPAIFPVFQRKTKPLDLSLLIKQKPRRKQQDSAIDLRVRMPHTGVNAEEIAAKLKEIAQSDDAPVIKSIKKICKKRRSKRQEKVPLSLSMSLQMMECQI